MQNAQTLSTSATQTTQNSKDSLFIKIVAIVVLVAFALLIYFMISHLESDDKFWSRALYLFGGVEAVAFAASGYLFGREIRREQINKAEEQTETAKQEAQQAQQKANDAQHRADTAETKAKDIIAAVQAAGSSTD